MKIKLIDIVTIQTGFFAKPQEQGDIMYLQTKHFDENGELSESLFPDLNAEQVSKKHLLENNDILFSAKGTRNFATVYQNQLPAVASTSFFVLKIIKKDILPAYIAWFINHPNTMSVLKAQAKGSVTPSITKNVLEELEISIPNLQIQKTILKITQLRNKEKTIRQRIEVLRENQIQQQILNVIK